MPFAGSEVARTRSQIAVATRCGTPEAVTTARRDHAAAKLRAYVAETIATAPPLTNEQREAVAALLRGGAA